MAIMVGMDIAYGQERLEVAVPDAKLVAGRRGAAAPALADVPAAVRQVLDSPGDFPPLRQALTPDDHVAVVVGDEDGPRPEVVSPILDHLLAAGLRPEAVTLLSPPGGTLTRPPLTGVRFETHDPADRRNVSYLATTRAGRRIYLNRTLVDADQLVVVGTAGYDPLLGYGGGLGDVFPRLSDEATRTELLGKPSDSVPGVKPWPASQEANEVGWLLGMPFLVQVVEGAGNSVAHVLAGSAAAVTEEAHRLLNHYWRVTVDRFADLVVAGVSGRQTFANVTRATACAARVVRPGGRIVVLSQAGDELGDERGDERSGLGPAADLLRGADDPLQALALLRKQPLPDSTSAWRLATAARHAQLYLLSGLPANTVEELFATPLDQAGQVRRLVEAADSCLFLPDAQRTLAVIGKDAAA